MAVHELILLLCEIARDKWCRYWEHDPDSAANAASTAVEKVETGVAIYTHSKRHLPFAARVVW